MKLPFWKRKERNNQLNEEVQAHLTLAEREAMEAGRPKEDAKVAALKEFGNVALAEEVTRDMWGWRWLRDLLQDIRYGLRMLRLNPGFTAVAVLTLALGIGANTAIFSLIDAVMLRMLPVQKPEELLFISSRSAKSTSEHDRFLAHTYTNPTWEQIRDRQDVFSGIFAWSSISKFDLSQGGESHNVKALYVSGEFFNTLGVRPATGRLLTTSDDVRGCTGTAVLSYGFWQRHYGGTPSTLGSMINLSGHSFQVVGVTAQGFFGLNVGQDFDVAVPVCTDAIVNGKYSDLDNRDAWWLNVMGRPKPGISPEQVNARLQVLSPRILADTVSQYWMPERQRDFVASILVASPSATGLSKIRQDYDQPLKMLMAVVVLVLLIACANIASLMLARAATRRKEIAVRLSLGASRFRLIRQLLTECILLSCAGALLGVLFARWGCSLLVHFISTARNPVFLELSLDGRILGFTAAIAVATGLLFGVLPAFRSTRVSLSVSMKGGNQSAETESRSHFRPGQWIVASQVALSLVLMIVAGLFLRSFTRLLTRDMGFDRTHVLIVHIDEQNAAPPGRQITNLNQQILDRLASLPGAISVSESAAIPLGGGAWRWKIYLDSGHGPVSDDAQAAVNFISPDYFATLRTPLRTGRNFDERDGADAPLVAIINETMARKFFPHSDPIGRYVRENVSDTETPPTQVIGVVKDANYTSLHETIPSTIYFPIAQMGYINPAFEIRTASPPTTLARSVEEAITGVNKNISLSFQTLEEQVDDSLRQDKMLATLSGFFGGLALILAMIGLYGVLAYMVTQRRKEIGIRMALGAGRESILWLVLRDVSILLIAGISAGVVVSLWATQFLQKMLFELKARDTTTIIFSAALLAAVALVAGYLPARRASRLNPMTILRDE